MQVSHGSYGHTGHLCVVQQSVPAGLELAHRETAGKLNPTVDYTQVVCLWSCGVDTLRLLGKIHLEFSHWIFWSNIFNKSLVRGQCINFKD